MKKKYMISCGSTSWVGGIPWLWKYGRHCELTYLLSFWTLVRLLFSLCSPLAPFSAHLNAWNRSVLTMKILHWAIQKLRATKGACRLFLVSGTLLAVYQGLSQNCPHSWDARVVPTNMHGIQYMAAKALMLSLRSVWCHSNHVKAHASDATIKYT